MWQQVHEAATAVQAHIAVWGPDTATGVQGHALVYVDEGLLLLPLPAGRCPELRCAVSEETKLASA